jgi:peptidoglycan/LPS O-acetylase OafA/YrhL
MERVPQLDGLRGIAVSLVVLFHYGSQFEKTPILGIVISNGWIGVDLFFVMSGYLIGGIVLADKDASNLYSVFYLRRLLRIFPLYYFLFLAVVVLVGARWLPAPTHSLAWSAVYLQNMVVAFTHDYGLVWLQPTWSLAVEEHFYLILPLLIVLTPSRWLGPILIAGLIVPTLVRVTGYMLPVEFPRDFARFFTFCRLDDLFYGVFLASLLQREIVNSELLRTKAVYFRVTAAALLIGLTFVSLCDDKVSELLVPTIGLALLGPLFLCILILALTADGWISQITKLRALRWVGIRTYAIYLIHMPALEGLESYLNSENISVHGLIRPTALIITLALASLSWWSLESGLIKFGHRFKYRLPIVC